MVKVKKIAAREIFDSRGIPAVEAKLSLDNGTSVTAQSSSGESLGKYEQKELRDGVITRFEGQGVKKAVELINGPLAKSLAGTSVEKHHQIDEWLIKADGTENTHHLGVNTVMTLSQLYLKAAALTQGISLYKYINSFFNKTYGKSIKIRRSPGPIFNMINGGKHGNQNLEFQEFQIVPSTSKSLSEAVSIGVEMYSVLRKVLVYRNAGVSISEEGGFTPNLLTNTNALDILAEAVSWKKFQLGLDVSMGVDFASSWYFKDGKYAVKDKPAPLKLDDYLNFLKEICEKYKILMVEDAAEQEDFGAWTKLNSLVGQTSYIVGDDFLAGQLSRLNRAVAQKACSAILIKFNQVATFSQIFRVAAAAADSGLKIIISHRLGESNDSILADLAVGIQADFVKFGPPVRGERIAKYNRLLEIEKELNSSW